MADELRRFLDSRPLRSRRASSIERARRWCRRNPAPAAPGALAAALTLAVAVVSTNAAATLRRQKDALEAKKTRTVDALGLDGAAEGARTEELGRSYLTQADTSRQSRRAGQRFEALAAVARAAEIARASGGPPGRLDALRDEAIAALALPDVREAAFVGSYPAEEMSADSDERSGLYARCDRAGNFSVRRMADDVEVSRGDGRRGTTAAWCRLAPGGGALAVNSDAWLRVWRVGGPAATLILDVPPGEYDGDLAFRPDGRELIYSARPPRPWRGWRSPPGRSWRRRRAQGWCRESPAIPTAAAWPSPSSATGSGRWRSARRTTPLPSASVTTQLPGPGRRGLAWNPDGERRQLVAGGAGRQALPLGHGHRRPAGARGDQERRDRVRVQSPGGTARHQWVGEPAPALGCPDGAGKSSRSRPPSHEHDAVHRRRPAA